MRAPNDRRGEKGRKVIKKDIGKRYNKYFLNIADILGDYNVNTRK